LTFIPLLDFPKIPTIFRLCVGSGRIPAAVKKMRCINVLVRIREAGRGLPAGETAAVWLCYNPSPTQ